MSNVVASNLIDRVSGESTPMLNAVKGSAKAWGNFDGTTTPLTIRDAYNILGITDNGTGSYFATFETPMPDTSYSVVGSSLYAGVSATHFMAPQVPTVNGFDVITVNPSGSVSDSNFISVSVFK